MIKAVSPRQPPIEPGLRVGIVRSDGASGGAEVIVIVHNGGRLVRNAML